MKIPEIKTDAEINADLDMIIRATKYFLKYSAIDDSDEHVAELRGSVPDVVIVRSALLVGFIF